MLLASGAVVPIKDIRLGDVVVATDPETGQTSAEPVTVLHLNLDKELTDVTVSLPGGADGSPDQVAEGKGGRSTRGPTATIHTTADHPFWDATAQRWVGAGDLVPGQSTLVTDDGQVVEVVGVRNYRGEQWMHNLTVANLHTYYVLAGNTPVLVHNDPASDGGPYNRRRHYGRTPTAADRRALGAGPGQVVDHVPSLVERYYNGDPSVGEKPGIEMTAEERRASANDRSRMQLQDRDASNRQGADLRRFSMQMKEEFFGGDYCDFERCATAHFADYWQAVPRPRRLSTGRFFELPSWFSVLEFKRDRTWRYATVGMSNGDPDGIEAFIISPDQNLRAVEFLYALAHFHRTGEPLNFGHTVYFGEALWDGSRLDHGFLSYPYLEPIGFESFDCDGGRTSIAWLIPITSSERDYKKANGIEALESLFEDRGLDYLNPLRTSLA